MAKTNQPEEGDITHLIERLDAFEERYGVRFESLNAEYFLSTDDSPEVRVAGEIHARDGLAIAHKLKVVITAYDEKGRVLNSSDRSIANPDVFYGFEAFCLQTNADGNKTAKIRVYPQQREY